MKYSCDKHGNPICTIGAHFIADDDWVYRINPRGGYGRDEVLCCEACIKEPKNKELRRRMFEVANCKEFASEFE